MSILSENLKYLRNKAGITQELLAEKVKYSSPSAVQKWESGAAEPRFGTLRLIATYFGVSTDDLAYIDLRRRDEENLLNIPNIEKMPTTRSVPILGIIACGEPILAEQNIDGYAEVPSNIRCDFILRCKGDSMTGARIYDGDVIFIRSQTAVNNGEIAAVIINDEATLKRVYYYPEEEKLILSPENPRYAPLVYMGGELSEIKIIGKAIAFQSSVI